jgi:hypothetical protein
MRRKLSPAIPANEGQLVAGGASKAAIPLPANLGRSGCGYGDPLQVVNGYGIEGSQALSTIGAIG